MTSFNSFPLKPSSFFPPGGTELQARSSSADGIHSGAESVGPTFDSWFFSILDDDRIAVHGSLYQMRGLRSSTNSFIVPIGEAILMDVLRSYLDSNYDVLGTATVTSANFQSTPLEIMVDNPLQEVQDVIDDAYRTSYVVDEG